MNRLRDMEMSSAWPDPDRVPGSVLVGMSGGLDSTFAAWWLKHMGLEVIGVHLQMGDFGPSHAGPPRCCSPEDERDARMVAAQIGIPFYVLPVAKLFEREVIVPFARDYGRGLTPNPCVRCNPAVKWKILLDKARELGIDAIATGHHARVIRFPRSGTMALLRGMSDDKDQSYFLHRLLPEQLAKAVMPAGLFTKARIRKVMDEEGFRVAQKPESQEVCFAQPGEYARIVERVLGAGAPPPGEIVDGTGRVRGLHGGIHNFTIGQRRGLMVSARRPLYVVDLDPVNHRITVGPREKLDSYEAMLEDIHWLGPAPDPADTILIKVRYKSEFARCRVEADGDRARVIFERPASAVTPGQAGVIYRGERVLGGGTFSRAGNGAQTAALPPGPGDSR